MVHQDWYTSLDGKTDTTKMWVSFSYPVVSLLCFYHRLLTGVITWLCEINLTSLYKHRVFLVKSTGSLKSTGTWWNQPEHKASHFQYRKTLHWLKRLGVDCFMWLTSNHMFFGWFWEKLNRRFLTKLWNHPRFARGDFKILLKPWVDFFPNHPQTQVITSTNICAFTPRFYKIIKFNSLRTLIDNSVVTQIHTQEISWFHHFIKLVVLILTLLFASD